MRESNQHTADDQRVGDVLAESDSGLDEELDPALIARLAGWFGGAPLPEASSDEKKRFGAEQARRRAMAAVDPELRARLEDQGERSATMLRPAAPVKAHLNANITRFDFEVWGLTTASELREIERPDDIIDIMQENTPQAVLRDLYRPVRPPPGRVFYEPTPLVSQLSDPHDIVLDVMAMRLTADMTGDLSPGFILRQDRAELRETLAEPWENSKPEKPSAMPSLVPSAENLYWFGTAVQGWNDE